MNFNLLMSFHRKLISMTSMGDLIHGLVGIPSSTALMFCNLILSELRDQDDLGPALITFILNALQSNQLGIYRSWSALKLTLTFPFAFSLLRGRVHRSGHWSSIDFIWHERMQSNAVCQALAALCGFYYLRNFAYLWRIAIRRYYPKHCS